MAQRRLEDREVSLLLLSGRAPGFTPETAHGAHTRVACYTFSSDRDVRVVRPSTVGCRLDASAVVLDIPTEQSALLVVGAELRQIPRGESEAELMQSAARGVVAWRRERSRARRRLELPDRLVALSEQLHRAPTLRAAYDALAAHVARVVGGYTGIVFVYDTHASGVPALRPLEHPDMNVELADCALGPELRFGGPGLVHADEVLAGTGGRFHNLTPVIQATRAATLPYVPLGERGVLFLVERRLDRAFDPEDWGLLRSVARLAELALDRIELYDRVHDLSLTDPLTGLANRRRLDVVLEHTFAAARRGHELSVVMIDLDRFKQYNDEFGHVRGDEILRSFAGALREQVRASDLVVRYGGDEFLIVMAGASRTDAEHIIARIRAGVTDIGFTAGVAEYSAALNSPQELIDRADRDLYAHRRKQAAAAAAAEAFAQPANGGAGADKS